MAVFEVFGQALDALDLGVGELALVVQCREKIGGFLPALIPRRAHLQGDFQGLAVVKVDRTRPGIESVAREAQLVQPRTPPEIAGRGSDSHAVQFHRHIHRLHGHGLARHNLVVR